MDVDAVIIGGGEGPAFAPVMQKMAELGIPCITVDITSEYSTCNLTSDNFNGGEQLALYVTNKLGGKAIFWRWIRRVGTRWRSACACWMRSSWTTRI